MNKYFPVIDPKLHDDNGKNTSTPVALCDHYKVDQSIYLYIHINELALHLSLHHSNSYPGLFLNESRVKKLTDIEPAFTCLLNAEDFNLFLDSYGLFS